MKTTMRDVTKNRRYQPRKYNCDVDKKMRKERCQEQKLVEPFFQHTAEESVHALNSSTIDKQETTYRNYCTYNE